LAGSIPSAALLLTALPLVCARSRADRMLRRRRVLTRLLTTPWILVRLCTFQ